MKSFIAKMMFVVFLCAVAVAFSVANSCKKQETAPKDPVFTKENQQKIQEAPLPVPDKVVPKSNIGWLLADELMDKKEMYFSGLGLNGYPGADSYNEAYFRSLKERKEAIIAWSLDKNPSVVFIGQVHLNLAEEITPEKQASVQEVQNWSFNRVKEHYDASVIVFEDSGSAEDCGSSVQVTLDVMIENLRRETRRMSKKYPELLNLTDKDFEQIIQTDQQTQARVIRDSSAPPVFLGEEWPNQLEVNVLMNMSAIPWENAIIFRDFTSNFNRLRSEIIFIRTLEFVKKLDGRKGVIIQGYMHGQDIKGFENEYGVRVELIMPPISPAP